RAPVVELHVRAELDLPGRVVEGLPRDGEVGAHLPGLEVADGEVVEDVVAEDDRLPEDRVGRVPVVDVRLERVDDGVVLRLGGQGGSGPQAQGQDGDAGGGARATLGIILDSIVAAENVPGA